jgi:hypothetical protein
VEVVHPIVSVEDLTSSSSEEAEVVHLTQELELWVGAALGISLSKVCTSYFRDSDVDRDLVEEQNFGDVIENHA